MNFYESPPLPEDPDEYLDYDAILPYSDMMPMDYKFSHEPIFHSLLESRKDKSSPAVKLTDHMWLKIQVNTVQSPSSFYFCLDRQLDLKYSVHQKIRDFFRGDGVNPPGLEFLILPCMVKIGMAVVAYHGSFVRAYVEQLVGQDRCVVRDVDNGGQCVVYKKNLHFIPKWLAQYPVFTYRGMLTGVKPVDTRISNWDGRATSIFEHIIRYEDNDKCTAVVHYFTKDGRVALYMHNSRGHWVDEELIYRLAARQDTTPFDKLNAASAEENEEMALIEDVFIKLPSPKITKTFYR